MVASERQRVVLIGGVGGAREHAIAGAIAGGPRWNVNLYTTARTFNPGIEALSSAYAMHSETDIEWAAQWANKIKPNFVFIGSEQPLVAGIVDELAKYGIPSVGPSREAAQIEGSKLFLRQLMQEYEIPGNIEFHHITGHDQHRKILEESPYEYAIKPIGLTGGKGVKVMGEQLLTVNDAIDYGNQILEDSIGGNEGFLLEKREKGPEFTLQTFEDGVSVLPMRLVRDLKKAFEGDLGPNTGSMGSYSQADGLLPFVNQQEFDEALDISKQISAAMSNKGMPFKGVKYNQFMKTKAGLRVIEVNCRFGDPEALNELMILRTSLVDISEAIIAQRLSEINLEFDNKATVVKYIAPQGYPDAPLQNVFIQMDEESIRRVGGQIFFAQVKPYDDGVLTTASRVAAVGATGDTIADAEIKVSASMRHIQGRRHVRNDIGREELLRRDEAFA